VKGRVERKEGGEGRLAEFEDKIMETYGLYPVNPGYLYPYFNHDDAWHTTRPGTRYIRCS
jgi:hypothetical protein